jgi:hypothetical protein
MEKSGPDTERRKDLRLGIPTPFLIRINISKGKGIFKLRPKRFASTRNISTSGILLDSLVLNQNQMGRIISGQDRLILELDIPYLKKPLRITGKIIWSGKKDKRGKTVYEAGISFEDIKEKDRERLLPLLVNLCLKGKAKI